MSTLTPTPTQGQVTSTLTPTPTLRQVTLLVTPIPTLTMSGDITLPYVVHQNVVTRK
jgi:hypothetical protein